MEIKFSKIVLEELHTKLEILCSEPELAADYNMTEDEASALYLKFGNFNKPGFYTLDEKEAAAISGELDNACDIFEGDKCVRSFRHVISQIKHGGAFKHQLNLKAAREARPAPVYPFGKNSPRPKGLRGRRYPVREVVESMCGQVEDVARALIARYEQIAKDQGRHVTKITDRKIRYFATTQNRGRAYYNRGGERLITIPVWVFKKDNEGKPGYSTYYIAHELAHHYAHFAHKCTGHGEMFMWWLKQLCPVEYQKYEHGYKPKFAKAYGVAKTACPVQQAA